ncbi:single-stranded DNA-binding protein [Myroides sp. WP-1]|uniref:single-stranded DNA-binding protein n=1 Tax=Myroides sp. WP-1 TaxID=2759944 RepID=UPI0015F7EE90|nr:single-stranded DNA-binding protein [Myroides sp. WP-1]MBB1140209.1 single-stranded DNA-binding protein [Myroides sp. WP-1]
MSSLRNRVQLIGRAGQDAEIIVFGTEKKRATFSIAINEFYYNDKGDKIENVQWHNVVVWGKLADVAEKYVIKGKEVAIEGKLVNRSYEDKDNKKRYITEIVVSELLF